jgi:hypothetical protein
LQWRTVHLLKNISQPCDLVEMKYFIIGHQVIRPPEQLILSWVFSHHRVIRSEGPSTNNHKMQVAHPGSSIRLGEQAGCTSSPGPSVTHHCCNCPFPSTHRLYIVPWGSFMSNQVDGKPCLAHGCVSLVGNVRAN